jgi:hypothetical protein
MTVARDVLINVGQREPDRSDPIGARAANNRPGVDPGREQLRGEHLTMNSASNTTTPPLYVPRSAQGASSAMGHAGPDDQVPALLDNMVASVELYAREKPWQFGLWMAGVGFVLGWKLKFF